MTIDRTSDTIDSSKLRAADGTPASAHDDEDLLPPLTQKGPYQILDLLGEGGMGRVYLARHTVLGREVALKTLRRAYAHDTAAVARFFGEARAVNQIAHENIVEITDFVDHGDDKYYIMELLRGATLSGAMRTERPFPLDRTLHIMRQVASALAAVHKAHIVHRDLKPDNIFLTTRGHDHDFVKVLDFGVAKLDERHGPLATTAVGALIGTPEYMSPEQLGGKSVDHRSDIYSFSLILYELVTGQRAFEAQSFGDLVVKHLTQQPLPPRKVPNLAHAVPRALDDLILQGLAKQPEDRPSSMDEIVARLVSLDPRDATSGAIRSIARGRSSARRSVFVAAVAGACAAAAALVVAADVPEPAPPPVVVAPDPVVAPPPPPPPETIQVTFESSPSGAEVRLEGEEALLGVTPCVVAVEPRAAGRFRFSLDGHEPLTVEQSLKSDAAVKVVLAPKALSGDKKRPAGSDVDATKRNANKRANKRAEDRRVGDLLDPFAE